MKKILFATDFSPSCDNALSYTIEMVKRKEIIVDVINVYDIPLVDQSRMPYKAIDGLVSERRAFSEKSLNAILEKIPEANRGQAYPVFGVYPSIEIAELAEERGLDLIVMSLKKKYGVLDKMIGSITAHTIQKTDIPVLAIPAEAHYTGLTSILFPTMMDQYFEIEEKEERSLEWLHEFWGIFHNPDIHLVHIEKDPDKSKIDVTIGNAPFISMQYTLTYARTVHEGIIRHMEKELPDLIAFYKPIRKFWERIYHGSETRKLLYESKIPLLIFG